MKSNDLCQKQLFSKKTSETPGHVNRLFAFSMVPTGTLMFSQNVSFLSRSCSAEARSMMARRSPLITQHKDSINADYSLSTPGLYQEIRITQSRTSNSNLHRMSICAVYTEMNQLGSLSLCTRTPPNSTTECGEHDMSDTASCWTP